MLRNLSQVIIIIIRDVSISCFQAPPGHASLMSAGWGRLSSAILVQDWDTALEELNKLRRDIDESVSCPIKYQVPAHTYTHISMPVCTVERGRFAEAAAASLADPLESLCLLQPPQGAG